jgi:hypothetical protein
MKLDPVILRRFLQLSERAEEVASSSELVPTDDPEFTYSRIPYPDFVGWMTNALGLIQRVFGDESVHFRKLSQLAEAFREYESQFESCRAVFLAAREDYEGGYLFSVRALIKAEVLSDALDQAKQVLSAGYKDPACVLAGVSLEVTLKELAERNGISLSKVDKMNSDLAKAEVYNLAKQKQVTAWADLRNKAAHGQWSDYSDADVDDMIRGIERFMADFL